MHEHEEPAAVMRHEEQGALCWRSMVMIDDVESMRRDDSIV